MSVGLAATSAWGCGEKSDVASSTDGARSSAAKKAGQPNSSDTSSPAVGTQASASIQELTQNLRDGPTIPELVAALGQPHLVLRELVGEHHLHYVASFSLAPVQPLGRPPRVGEQIETSLAVEDELDVVWAEPDQEGLRMSVRQSNDQSERRDLVITGGTAYTRLHEETWYSRPVDGELHELWLDDAVHAVRDMVEFAAPQLVLSAPEAVDVGGRPAYAFDLSLSETRDESLGRASPTSRWRAQAQLVSVEGRAVLDAATGAALRAELSLSFKMRDAAGRPMTGRTKLDSTLEIGPQAPPQAPEALPMPERHRYAVERKKLLDGLAAL